MDANLSPCKGKSFQYQAINKAFALTGRVCGAKLAKLQNNHFIHPTVYIAKKGLYTLLSRCIDPWNNRKVWVGNYFQMIGFPVSLGLYHISSFPSSGLFPPLKLGASDPASNCWAFISCTCIIAYRFCILPIGAFQRYPPHFSFFICYGCTFFSLIV